MGNPSFRSSNPPISIPICTTPSFRTMTIAANTKFTLLNDQGDALSGFYMLIQSFPGADRPGRAMYVDARGTTDKIKFLFNQETNVYESWHVKSPANKFTMTPRSAGSVIVGLDVQFSHINDFVAHFALDISDEDDENVVYDILAPPVHLNELRSASF